MRFVGNISLQFPYQLIGKRCRKFINLHKQTEKTSCYYTVPVTLIIIPSASTFALDGHTRVILRCLMLRGIFGNRSLVDGGPLFIFTTSTSAFADVGLKISVS